MVPLFQRPYVWAEKANWRPLWEDVKAASEAVEAEALDEDARHDPRTYFLGAVVIQSRKRQPKRLSSSNVIDGQQRLTTLQVLLAAARRVALQHESQTTGALFGTLLDNKREAVHAEYPQDLHKLWPLPQDNAAFRWALSTSSEPIPPELSSHKLIKAAIWFQETIATWADLAKDPDLRLGYLFETLRDRMQLVEILLDGKDDPQVIFEALNHRGVPLDAADLVKNLLFQKVEQQGDHSQADSLLLDSWLPLDGQEWRRQVTTGRMKRSRIDLLLSYWLTIRTAQEISAEHLFAEFRDWLQPPVDGADHVPAPPKAAELIVDIRRYADEYNELDSLPHSTPIGGLVDRMKATGTMTPWPLLLQVFANGEVPPVDKDRLALAVDSFLMRRGICKMSAADYNKMFVSLIDVAARSEPDELVDDVIMAMASNPSDSRRWPTDDEFFKALTDSNLYSSVYRARLKTLLVGLENHLHTGKTEPDRLVASTESRLNIEHLMPQEWRKHWALPENHSEEQLQRRTSVIHQLGNLTLLTTKLNPSVGNKNWQSKKPEIQKHSLLRLTTGSVLSRPEGASNFSDEQWSDTWDETRVIARSRHLAAVALKAWPRPALEILDDSLGD